IEREDIERAAADIDAVASAEVSYDVPAEPLAEATSDQEAAFDGFGSTFDPSIAVDDSGLVDYSDGQRRSLSEEDRPAAKDLRPTPTQPRRSSDKPNSASFQAKGSSDADDATVRIPVRQLKQINNLFSELTIERNGLELYLKRLRVLLGTLRQRIKTLDQTNVNLRSAYDRVTTRAELEQGSLGMSPQPPRSSAIAGSSRQLSASHALTESFDALELDQYGDMHLMSQEVMETIVQIQEVATDLELSMDDTDHTFRGLNKTAKQLQTKMTQLQMRPLSDILERFPRALRQMSLEHGKSAELKVYGGNLLIDRNILEALNEPLLHLLRNAFDHGIEDPGTRQASEKPAQGTIEIRASHRNSRTIVSIHDDGKGIDLEKIRARARQMGLDDMLLAAASEDELISLIFEPGFSTSSQVTDLSGRGVGMDVVRDGIKQLQGEISVDTQLNQGTTFTLSLPFTLSITRVLLVESTDMLLAFPTDVIEEMTAVSPEQILKGVGGEVLEWEEQVVQFVRLHQWLRFNCPRSLESPEAAPSIKESTVLMVTHNDQVVGLQVGRCWGEQEVAIRYVEGSLPMPPGFSSCTILGDGRVVPMVNVSELLRWIISDERDRNASAQVEQSSPTEQPTAVNLLPGYESPTAPSHQSGPLLPTPSTSHKPAVLIVDDSINVRRFLALTLEKAGYRVEQAKDGQDAVDKLTGGLAVQAVLCDIEMPRLDGYGVLARVKSNPSLAQIPIAMLTSRSGDKHRKLAMSLGAAAYFSKPYNEQVLLQSLRQMVELAVAI
ncbi:MAG: hybrid sensor histidine kinase/response regulator, partial [Elainellaceae cyanobacterium]